MASRGTYGSPSIWDELVKAGEPVGKKRVARLMFDQGLSGRPEKKFVRATDSAHELPVAKNLVQRQFEAERPDRLWVADISYIATPEGVPLGDEAAGGLEPVAGLRDAGR